MEILQSMTFNVSRFLGKQRVTFGTYVPSNYNYFVQRKDSVLIVYNSFTRVTAIINQLQWDALHACKVIYDEAHPISHDVSDLISNRLLVPKNIDEEKDYLALYDIVSGMSIDHSVDSYTVLTTTGCNARCFYCFEADFRAQVMLKNTAEAVAEYMIKNSNGKMISIHWFGGEPLCNTAAIDTICDILKKNNVPFTSSMTSNGFAFTKQIVENAAENWNLKFVQITFDGLHDEHNRRKNFYQSESDPFINTIQNIHELLKVGIGVSIRINFDSDNLTQIPELVDYFAVEFSGEKRISAYPAALYEDCSAWKPDRNADEQIRLIREQVRLTQYIRDHFHVGEKSVAKGFSMYYCGANNKKHRTINPNGSFSVCHNVGDNVTYGSVFDGITDDEKFRKWTENSRLREKCKDCIWLPECTAFDMCPVKKSYCKVDRENQVRQKIESIYLRYMK